MLPGPPPPPPDAVTSFLFLSMLPLYSPPLLSLPLQTQQMLSPEPICRSRVDTFGRIIATTPIETASPMSREMKCYMEMERLWWSTMPADHESGGLVREIFLLVSFATSP